MRFSFSTALIELTLVATLAVAQNGPQAPGAPKSVTVPVTLDHGRVIVDVNLPLADGSTKRVRGWVDTGDSKLWMSDRVAGWMGLSVSCDGQICSGKATPRVVSLEVLIGGMKIFLSAMGEIRYQAALAPSLLARALKSRFLHPCCGTTMCS